MYKLKYSFVGKEQKTDFVHDGFVFSLWALSNSTNIATEVLVYPWTSLVAEFGGTLGMKQIRPSYPPKPGFLLSVQTM